jgi:hypothetical protein
LADAATIRFAMTFVQAVPVGAMIFLECGCRGHRLTPRDDQEIIMIVEEPCLLHAIQQRGHLKYLDPLTTVSPFSRRQQNDL